MGKLFLSQLPEKKRALLVRSIPLYRYTENTITEAVKLEAELEAIRKTEISIDNQEFLAGVVCVAVPVRSAGGQRVAALAISAPLARMSSLVAAHNSRSRYSTPRHIRRLVIQPQRQAAG